MEHEPNLSSLEGLLQELEVGDDREHADVAVKHESEWTLTMYPAGLITWENVEDGTPRHMRGVDGQQILRLMRATAQGDLALVEQSPWLAGYGTRES